MKAIIKKIFTFPPPTYFGAKNDLYLEIELFKKSKESYTWEKYDNDLKKNFPIKFFILKTIPNFIKYKIFDSIKNPLLKFLYFIKCHTLPRKKYHIINLSQPKTNTDDDYRYGWIDSDQKILFSCMNILVDYVEREFGLEKFIAHIESLKRENDKYSLLSKKEKNKEYNYQRDYNVNKDILNIYYWWKSDRKDSLRKIKNLELELLSYYKKDSINYREKYKEYYSLIEKNKNIETKMLILLIKCRSAMWT